MRCHHTWTQLKKDEVEIVNGLRTTRYFHECPFCGKRKETLRTDRSMPPKTKWKRELEKVVQRSLQAGYALKYNGSDFDLNAVTIHGIAL